jgi:phosphate:Na+ symporter
MVLGENIGTTITANIAASVGNTSAKRAALGHTVFNLFGVIWALIFFRPFLGLV